MNKPLSKPDCNARLEYLRYALELAKNTGYLSVWQKMAIHQERAALYAVMRSIDEGIGMKAVPAKRITAKIETIIERIYKSAKL